jgi:hypothetical protein
MIHVHRMRVRADTRTHPSTNQPLPPSPAPPFADPLIVLLARPACADAAILTPPSAMPRTASTVNMIFFMVASIDVPQFAEGSAK